VSRARACTDKPVAVGFGISKPEHVREVCEYADGAVVGSVLVDLIDRKAGSQDLLDEVHNLVSALKAGTR
jgi:tryptophan synthase alpha chain